MTDVVGDPYGKASYIPKLKESGIMVLTDLDGTFTTGDKIPSSNELNDRAAVRQLLLDRGLVAGAVTARTPALTMSSSVYQASKKLGFLEPEPKWGVEQVTGRRVPVPLEGVSFFDHSLDWDVSAGFGSGICLRNGHGYMVDHNYFDLLKHDAAKKGASKPEPWRLSMLAFLADTFPEAGEYMSPLENRSNYEQDLTDVAPLEYRFQLDFKGSSGLAQMNALVSAIERKKSEGHSVALRIALVDESRPDRNNPENSKYTLYLIPWGARKEKMINRLFSESAKAAGRPTKDLRLFYAGDTLTDLRAGLWGGGDAQTTFLLATGSRVAPYIQNREPSFGSESLDFLWSSLKRPEDRLQRTDEEGVYTFNLQSSYYKKPNRIVIGDERYSGMTPPGSVHAFLKEFL
ncbi:MAG: hypothetical protein JWL87_61 [Candidatus Adlerbacteria bacterium]|nr:hypothetical protein [Candidatus Adlerbacteria bacterium]